MPLKACAPGITTVLPRPVTVLLVSDEEVGSDSSRAITESVARRSSAVLVLEPAYGPRGAVKTARKGRGGVHHQGYRKGRALRSRFRERRKRDCGTGETNYGNLQTGGSEARPHAERRCGVRRHADQCYSRAGDGLGRCSRRAQERRRWNRPATAGAQAI